MFNYFLAFFSYLRGFTYRKIFLNIGKNSYLSNKAQILGIKNLSIGSNTTIGDFSLITINNRESNSIKFVIGNNVYIGRDNFFTIGDLMRISDYCIFGNKCSFISSNHNFSNPYIAYSLSGATSSNNIHIGVNCWLGYNVSVIGSVKIGHGSIIGANSVVLKDVPPFCILVGNPGKIIKRFSFVTLTWVKIEEITTQHDITNFPNENEYLLSLNSNNNCLSLAHHSASFDFGDL